LFLDEDDTIVSPGILPGLFFREKEQFQNVEFWSKVKEGENLALRLHFVQPQEYVEYFED
jgi:hypothetical protein